MPDFEAQNVCLWKYETSGVFKQGRLHISSFDNNVYQFSFT